MFQLSNIVYKHVLYILSSHLPFCLLIKMIYLSHTYSHIKEGLDGGGGSGIHYSLKI